MRLFQKIAMFKNIFPLWLVLIVASPAALISCRTSKTFSATRDEKITSTDSSKTTIDTTTTKTLNQTQQAFIYGDTLAGSLQFTDEQITSMDSARNESLWQVDSLESNGVKVLVSVTKTKAGVKTKVKAIAKPKQIINTSSTVSEEKKGESTMQNDKKTEQTIAVTESKTVKRWPAWASISLVTLLITGTLFFIYYKKKNYGEG